MGLDGSTDLECLPERAWLFQPPDHVARTELGRGPNMSVGSGQAPCVTRSQEHEERPAARREKCRWVKKNDTCMLTRTAVVYNVTKS